MGATTARLTIDLGALAANYTALAQAARPGTCGAVVKADAYGLGVGPVVQRLRAAGCRSLFVATAGEAVLLRALDSDSAIYVFAGADAHDAEELAARAITPVINHRGQLEHWYPHRDRPIALHVDTGMRRLGFEPHALAALDLSGFRPALLLTHLACADEPDHPQNARQRALFREVAAKFPGVATSVCNSAALLSHGGESGEICRPGIALYGGNPFAVPGRELGVVATLEADVLQLQQALPGEPVGYGATWTPSRPSLVATVGAGYGDGIPRKLSNRGEVSYGRWRLPIVGRVSMDLTAVDASAAADVIRVGDRVSFFGGGVALEEVAAWAETISYEVLTGLAHRLERRFVG